MGLSFNNVHVCLKEELSEETGRRIAEILLRGMKATQVSDASEADISISMYREKGSPWLTIASDVMEEDLDRQLRITKDLSGELDTNVLAIACFDSDYLCFNMVDAGNHVDLWAACGRFPYGKTPRRSSPAAWKKYVADLEHFKQLLRHSSAFAEDCLSDVAAELSLPAGQARCFDCDASPDLQVLRFDYRIEGGKETPPAFRLHSPQAYYDIGTPQLIGFLNTGASAKGVTVFLTGPSIREHQVNVEKVELQYGYHPNDLEHLWSFRSVELREVTFSNGLSGLIGDCPEIRIPAAVKKDLPQKKKMDMEFSRCIYVRLLLSACTQTETFGHLQVTLIPTKNYAGQCGVVLPHAAEFRARMTAD